MAAPVSDSLPTISFSRSDITSTLAKVASPEDGAGVVVLHVAVPSQQIVYVQLTFMNT